MPDPAAIVAEFQAELHQLATTLSPRDEVRRLWQIALEREALVSVAYRRDIIGRRLQQMPVDDATRQVVSRAIRWAWRDEEAHTLYIRGVLLQEGDRWQRAEAWRTAVEGKVAGWTSSRQAHYRWSQAPLKRTVAEALELGARLSGRIPQVIGSELHFHSFRDWCVFNVGAERTAELAWARLAELARLPEAGIAPEHGDSFARIAADELRHGRMFDVLSEAFDEHDRLRPGLTAATLEASMASVGQRFLRTPTEGDAAWSNPLGKGAPVAVVQGDASPAALVTALATALDTVDAPSLVPPGSRVALKTTFMLGVDRADPSPTVHPPLLRALVDWLVARGCEVAVLESPNIYDRFHRGRSVAEVADYLGLTDALSLPGVRLHDTQSDQVPHDYLRGLGAGTVSATWRDADVRIVLGALRSHPVDRVLRSLDALEGLGGRHDAFTFSDRTSDRHTALLAVADAWPPHLALLDAWAHVPDGLTGMMGCEHPLHPRRLYASRDAVSLDVVVSDHVADHRDDHDDHGLLAAAYDWFGDPRERLSREAREGADTPIEGWRAPSATTASRVLSALALPVWDHASARGALFVPPVDEAAFPPRDDPGAALRTARAMALRITRAADRVRPADALLPTRTLSMPWGALRVHDSGRCAPGEVPLVMLHGYPDNLQLFTRLVGCLPDRRCVAFDWPGQGRSAPAPHPPGPWSAAAQLVDVLDALGIDRALLVATDMGCHPALITAAEHPERVAGVVVMNGLLYGDGPTSLDIAVMRRSGLARLAFRYASEVVWRRCLGTFLAGDALPDTHLADLHDSFVQPHVREHLVALCDDTEARFDQLARCYPRVTCPVLALWAAEESHFPVAQGQRLAEQVGGQLVVVPQAGHWMVWTHAEAVAEQVRQLGVMRPS